MISKGLFRMIYDSEDLAVLNRVVLRKGCETAMVTFNPSLDEGRRRLMVDMLARQIAVARTLSMIGANDLEDLAAQIPVLEENIALIRLDAMEDYLSALGERDAEDEAHLLWMTEEFRRQLPLLKEAAVLAEEGSCGLSERDLRLILSVRDSFEIMAERFEGQDPEVLDGADGYAHAMLDLCSALLRILALKGVSSGELSGIVMELDRVDGDSFRLLARGVLGPQQTEDISSFEMRIGRYVAALYARCIVNSTTPGMALVSDIPDRFRGIRYLMDCPRSQMRCSLSRSS